METISFNGWNCLRLANQDVELIITRDVGPRVIRFGYMGATNMFREMPGQQGGRDEAEWQIRGGHRLWVAPESKPWSYELDNVPYALAEPVGGGVRVRQDPGPLTGLIKEMTITLTPDKNEAVLIHSLINAGQRDVECSPWAMSVMNLNGQAIIPLPAKIPHTERLTHNQTWNIWAYTDLSDPRWTFGKQFVLFRQDPNRGPNKLGIAHREKWIAYQLDGFLFVKHFDYQEGQPYPDDGCSFEVFADQQILELESLGPLTRLQPGDSVQHVETWQLFKDVPFCKTEDDVVQHVLPLLG